MSIVTNLSKQAGNSRRSVLFFVLLAILAGGAAGILVLKIDQPAYILAGLVGLAVFAGTIFSVELGLFALIFLTYTRLSDIAVHMHNAPSIAKFFVVLLVVAILIRWAIFQERPQGWVRPAILLGLYGLVGVASIISANDPTRVWETITDYLKDAIIALVVVILLQRGESFRRVIWVLLIVGIFLGTLSAYQALTRDFERSFWGFAQAKLMQIVGEANDYRIGGPIGDPNYYAQILVVLVPLALERFIHERKLILKSLAAWALLVTIFSIIFTYSRGGFLSMIVVLVLMFLFFPPRVYQAPIFIVSLLVMAYFVPSNYFERVLTLRDFLTPNRSLHAEDISIRSRTSENLAAWEMFKDHPFLGVGWRNYPLLYVDYAKEIGLAPEAEERSAHNLYLEVAAETGAFGIASFGLMLGASLYSLFSSRKKLLQAGFRRYAEMITAYAIGLIGYLTAAFFIHAAYPRYLYLLLGIALSVPMIVKNELALKTKAE